MGAIADLSDLVNRITDGNSGTPATTWFYKDSRVAGAAAVATFTGQWTSLWEYEGFPGGAGSRPGGTARNPTGSTQGALGQPDASGGRQNWLLSMSATTTGTGGQLVLFDRLADISGLDATVITAQNTTNLSVTRYTTNSGAVNRQQSSCFNQIWVEIYDQIGSTATTISAQYSFDNSSGRTSGSVAFGGSGNREAGRMLMLPTNQDLGVTSVESVDLVASTTTAGNFGVNILRPIVSIPIVAAGVGAIADLVAGAPQMAEILPGACLMLAWCAGTSTAPRIIGNIQSVEA